MMKTMLLAAAAALTLGSATTFAATTSQAQAPQQYAQYGQPMQVAQSSTTGYTFTAPAGSGVNYHGQRNNDWIGSSGNG